MGEVSSQPADSDRKTDAAIILPRALGLPDSAFEQRTPLRGQITKREVRAVSLYALGLRPSSVVWDVGSGTGSVAVEAALIAHRGTVYAIERDEASINLLKANVDKWGSGNIRVMAGEAPGILDNLEDPDSVFIGGSGGRLADILDVVAGRLKLDGRIVVNLAVLERTLDTIKKMKELGFATELSMVSSSRGREMPDGATRLEALNPVFVVSAQRDS
ncbi:MAG TPA: precorrin-6Y C5,15-methyltransferase (decarboxylating) subunit CbiT [Dehalococcoidia bacterium]|nr:precorrin-6Y C5,15-methyltransferase (decarboxylating) subunit CbiT [Dehalococcoidia bacterium]